MPLQEDDLERYLDGDLSADERTRVDRALAADPALRAELQLRREIETALASNGEGALRANLERIGNGVVKTPPKKGPFRPPAFLWGIIAAFLVAMLLWWWLPTTTPSTPPAEPKQQEPLPEIIQPAPPIANVPGPDTQDPQADPPSQPAADPPAPPVVEEPATEPDPALLAAYAPNPALEFYVANPMRAEQAMEWQLAVNNPPGGSLSVDVDVAEAEPLSDRAFLLHLFTNDPQSFTNFEPLRSIALPAATGPRYAVRLPLTTSVDPVLLPGLYYLLLEEEATEQVQLVQPLRID